MKCEIEITKNKNGCWFWRLVAANGEILASSEAYSSKGACLKTVKGLSKAYGIPYKEI